MGEPIHTSNEFPMEEMNRIVANFRGRIGFYIEECVAGIAYEHHADQRFPTASICKVPIMIELFRQVGAGRLALDERRRLRGAFSTHGTGVLKLLEDEPELTLRDYCRLMIGVSDNMATDLLLEVVGPEAVNATLDAMGFPKDKRGQYYHRWDRLPKELQEQLERRPKAEEQAEAATTAA